MWNRPQSQRNRREQNKGLPLFPPKSDRAEFLPHPQASINRPETFLGLKRLNNRPWILLHNFEQSLGRSHWLSSALFPVLQCRGADSNHHGELALGYLELLANPFSVNRMVLEHSARFEQALRDRAGFLNALDKSIKKFLFHGMASCTNRRRTSISCADR